MAAKGPIGDPRGPEAPAGLEVGETLVAREEQGWLVLEKEEATKGRL
ncbi:MAG: hypothetical protein ACKO45_02830 [Cyanobium sp.]